MDVIDFKGVLRSIRHEAIQKSGQRLGEVYQLATVIDLRMTSEIEAAPDPEIEGVKNIHLGIIDEEVLEEKRQSLSPEDLEGLDLTNTLDRLKMASKLGIVGDQLGIEEAQLETLRDRYLEGGIENENAA